MQHGIIISTLQIVPLGFGIAAVAAVAQTIELADMRGADRVSVTVGDAQDQTPRVVGILSLNCTVGIDDLLDVALQIQNIIVGNRCGCSVGINQRRRSATFVIDVVENSWVTGDGSVC